MALEKSRRKFTKIDSDDTSNPKNPISFAYLYYLHSGPGPGSISINHFAKFSFLILFLKNVFL